METITFYAVRSKDGKYLRSKGYSGSGESWVDNLEKAKIWTKIGPANAQVTWWARTFPEYGIPDVIPLVASPGEPLNQDERVNKAIKKIKLEKLNQELWRLEEKYDKASREFQRHGSQYAKDRFFEAEGNMNAKLKEIETLKNS